MTNISLLSEAKESGNEWLRKQIDKLEEEGITMDDVLLAYTSDKETGICSKKMKNRDLAYLVGRLNQWFYKTL